MTALSAFVFTRLDQVVHVDLYRYGLQFNYKWAGQYWTYARLMLALLGVSIATGVISIVLMSKKAQRVLHLENQGKILAEKNPDSALHASTGCLSDYPGKEISVTEAELEALRRKVWSYRRLPTRLAGYVVTFVGVAVLVGSMVFSSSVWAIIGLVLVFWGVMFFFLKPTSFVKADLLDSASYSLLENVHRLVSEFGLKGKGVYLPPRYLKDLSSGLVYVSAKDEVYTPTLNEVEEAEDRIFLKNPNGVCLVPSGVALVNLFEKELGTSFGRVDLDYLERNLPKVIIEDLEIAKDLELSVEDRRVHVRMKDPIYKDLCDEERRLSRVCGVFGCPLCSSIACALARASGKSIVIDGNEFSQDGKVMDIYYRILEQ
jgi:hypothetical protein